MLSWEFVRESKKPKSRIDDLNGVYSIPNQPLIMELVDQVAKNPTVWQTVIHRTGDVNNIKRRWDRAKVELEDDLQASRFSTIRPRVVELCKPAKIALGGDDEAYDVLENTALTYTVYTRNSPSDHGETSERISTMTPDEVKFRALRTPIEEADDEKDPTTRGGETVSTLLIFDAVFKTALSQGVREPDNGDR